VSFKGEKLLTTGGL